MKLFAIAFGVVCGAAAGLFILALGLFSLFEYPQALSGAGALAGTVMLAFPKVAEFLEQQESKKRLAVGRPKPVYDFRGFQIAWPSMVAYGTVVLWCLGEAASIIASIMLLQVMPSFEGENAPKAGIAIAVLTVTILILGAYFVGRWIGARTSRLGIVAMLLIAPLLPRLRLERMCFSSQTKCIGA